MMGNFECWNIYITTLAVSCWCLTIPSVDAFVNIWISTLAETDCYSGLNDAQAVSSAQQLDTFRGFTGRKNERTISGVYPPLVVLITRFQLQEIATRRLTLASDVHTWFWSLLTARLKLRPSLPVCLFLSAPSSSPSSCLCSRNAPSWAATSQGQGSLWGRSFWAVCLKRRSGGIIKR